MRYALVGDQKIEAKPKLRGSCPNCQSEMIAKCGRVKVSRWAHKGRPPCDPCWESETEWHRNWKDQFPAERQEISHVDQMTGIAAFADRFCGVKCTRAFLS
jgi:competence protein CoiA